MSKPAPAIRSALSGILVPGRHGRDDGRDGGTGADAGATLTELTGFVLVSIAVRGGQISALSAAIERTFGTALPTRPARAAGAQATFIWSACDHWLAVGPRDHQLAARMAACAGDLASVTDLTGARTIVRIGGPRARDGMMKVVPVDLDPSVFSAGSAAVTVAAHIPVQIWQTDAAPTYEIACPRSYGVSLWQTLCAAFAAYGYEARTAP